ncbi:PAS-domain containing protein [Halomonas pacifica]|uniref:hybrid sensor histidine kinase/response regulator n=1 Tax=Bisbaumannia pacifica TaxID=77098 RepID=UPI002359420B|nr:PAS-domain containing protein [Halomonas pacifica]MDC8805088.1 PAS-domain containing protein [Halomonas pacifica]
MTTIEERLAAAEAARDEAQAAYRQLAEAIETISEGFTLYDADDRLVLCNRRFRDDFSGAAAVVEPGMRFETLIRTVVGSGLIDIGDTAPEAWIAARLARRRAPGDPFTYRRTDGKQLRVSERRTRGGGVVAIYTDITEFEAQRAHLEALVTLTEEAQARAEAARDQLTEALESIAEGFALYDADDRLVLYNSRFKEHFVTPGDLVEEGMAFEALLRGVAERGLMPRGFESAEAWIRERLAQHRDPRGPYQFVRSDGLCIQVSEHRTGDGGYVAVYSDITELEQHRHRLEERVAERTAELEDAARALRRSQTELRRARDEAQRASLAKSEFLANMSHEIRTPMNGVIGVAELLERTELTPQQAEYVALIQTSADTLLGLINEILDFSKIEAGRLELEARPFPLRDTLADTLQTLALRADEKGLELAVHIPPEIPDQLLGDPLRLRQVVVNLVGNAIKFTPRGEVVVDLALEAREAQRVRLGFEVRDTGIGIPEAQRRQIFEAFGQADTSTTRVNGGTGLGLSIAAQLVAMMGGEIRVDSGPDGRGSRFTFGADFGLAEAPAAAPRPRLLQDQRVLVVDDNRTNRRILEEILTSWGMRPRVVDGGAAALAALDAEAEPLPLALLDVMMPGMDGFTLAERLRAHPRHGDMALLMLSSGSRPGDAGRRQRLGIGRLLMKPVKQSELLEAVSEALGAEPRLATPTRADAEARPADWRPRRVLLVEDGVTNQRVAIDLLTQRGHRVELASQGAEALAALAERAFEVVLMDVHMPVMDGLTATRALRERERRHGGHLTVVAMTASATREDRQRCLAAGMDDYVTKPFRAAELYRAVEEPPRGVAVDEAAPMPAEPTPPVPAAVGEPVHDRAGALANLEGKEALLEEMEALFRGECPALMAEIEAAIAGADSVTLRRAAHTLKGSALVIGARALGAAALRLETLARGGELGEAPAVLTELKARLDELAPLLAPAPDPNKEP